MEERMVSRSLVPWPCSTEELERRIETTLLAGPRPAPTVEARSARPGSKGERCMIEASIEIGGSLARFGIAGRGHQASIARVQRPV